MEAKQENDAKKPQKWTLMFFFASDNNLSPSMLYQLKSIKSAGFQLDTNVVVHFDPYRERRSFEDFRDQQDREEGAIQFKNW